MNFIKKFIGASATDEVASIPSGKLFLTRSPQSPKGELECLYNDAFAAIRKTTTPYYYQLAVTRVFQEGEVDAHGSSGFDDSDEEDSFDDHETPRSISDANTSKDEWSFPILQDLRVHYFEKPSGQKAIAWLDLNGDEGDKFEFIVDEDVKLGEIDAFVLALFKSLYESKYHKSSEGITSIDQLQEFVLPKSELINLDSLKTLEAHGNTDSELGDEFVDAVSESQLPSRFNVDSSKAIVEPKGALTYKSSNFELHLYDPREGVFKLQGSSPDVTVKLFDLGHYEHTLFILSNDKENPLHFNVTLSQNLNPTFNFEHLSFVFNHFTADDHNDIAAFSWLFKFPDFNVLMEFQNKFMHAFYESLNQTSWNKTGDADQQYIVDAFSKIDLSTNLSQEERKLFVDETDEEAYASADEYEEDEDEEDEDDEEDEEEEDIDQIIERKLRGTTGKGRTKTIYREEREDEEDEFGDNEDNVKYSKFKSSTAKNSNLSTGIANNRNYVVRGDKLGVFKDDNKSLSYQTTISNLKDLKGNKFNPETTMLHGQDQFMIMSNKDHKSNALYKMDLTRGKIVEEWEVDESVPIVTYGPNTKFSQLTTEQTLTGLSNNGMFRIDPRLSGSKLVQDSTYKSYKTTNNDFSSLATTAQGYLAVGSKKGDIRLYDKLGLNAKSALPSLGEPILGVDVSKDGRWILATCKTYILLIDAKIGDGQKNSGSLGFTKYFDKDKKPTPTRLNVKPEHAAYIQMESQGKPLSFTKAYFNTGLNSRETSIVTSTGPYVISWSLKKVLLNEPDSYVIRRYQQNVVADNFKFDSNSDVILALQDDVSMTRKKNLQVPGRLLTRGKKSL